MPREVAEQCPDCDGPLIASARGTVRVCPGCRRKVAPAGVLAPYAGGGAARQVKSQRDSDLEQIELAGRKGVLLGELRRLAADDRLDDASQLKVEWFAEQVRAARTGNRLDALTELFAEAGIRARRWWQTAPAALVAADETGDYDDDADYDDGQGDGHAEVIALPAAAPRTMTWAVALAARRWQTAAPGGGSAACQIVDEHGTHCRQPVGGRPVIPVPGGPHVWICAAHHDALSATATGARGVA